MASGLELDRFLGELSTRRERVLRLAEPADLRPVDLLDELHELSEQLVVAEEELRVQQEELEEAHGALLSLAAERDLLLQHSTRAFVVTDERGVVLQSTRAARQLVRQPEIRVVPRPIASWFDVADRRAVRGILSRLRRDGGVQEVEDVQLSTSDGATVQVNLNVTSIAGADEARALLRWELVPVAAQLQLVAAPVGADLPAGAEAALALELAATAVELGQCAGLDDLVPAVLAAALRAVPSAQDAGLVLGTPVAPDAVGATSAAAEHADAAQLAARAGPVAHAMTASAAVRSNGLRQEVWGGPGLVGPPDSPGCAVSAPLVVGSQRFGVLTAYADDPDALDASAEAPLTALAMQVGLALHRLAEVQNLRTAISSREVVGQAVGILVERRQVAPEEAFALLVKWSQDGHVKLRSIAGALVETGEEPPPRRRP